MAGMVIPLYGYNHALLNNNEKVYSAPVGPGKWNAGAALTVHQLRKMSAIIHVA
jgi:hypothetical protein